MVDISHPLAQQAADLVTEIERFPASDQQTRCVTLAAELVKSISAFCAPRQEEPGGIWDAVERAAARVPPWVGLPAQQAKSLTRQAALRVVPPEGGPRADENMLQGIATITANLMSAWECRDWRAVEVAATQLAVFRDRLRASGAGTRQEEPPACPQCDWEECPSCGEPPQ